MPELSAPDVCTASSSEENQSTLTAPLRTPLALPWHAAAADICTAGEVRLATDTSVTRKCGWTRRRSPPSEQPSEATLSLDRAIAAMMGPQRRRAVQDRHPSSRRLQAASPGSARQTREKQHSYE